MPIEDYKLSKITSVDNEEVELLASESDGNKKFNAAFIQHWYFDNPSHSYSLWKVVVNDKIEGYATTNNFKYKVNGIQIMVAMPQNVLTSERIRGKGLFGRLYFKTEVHNLTDNNVAAFLTFTNSLSTQIFLNKFGYMKGKCPVVIFDLFSISHLFKKKNYEELKSIDEIGSSYFENRYCFDNAMQKDGQYYKWRYSQYGKNLHIIKVFDKENIIGYAFLKEEKKRGIKFLIIMDIIALAINYVSKIVNTCFTYSSVKFYSGTLAFDLTSVKPGKRLLRLKIKDRFNFLVKGRDIDESKMLSGIDFNMFFSDLDIV
ncbi:MAG: hypothetical protein ABI416_04485 [Ginsengibacter sp.]